MKERGKTHNSSRFSTGVHPEAAETPGGVGGATQRGLPLCSAVCSLLILVFLFVPQASIDEEIEFTDLLNQ